MHRALPHNILFSSPVGAFGSGIISPKHVCRQYRRGMYAVLFKWFTVVELLINEYVMLYSA